MRSALVTNWGVGPGAAFLLWACGCPGVLAGPVEVLSDAAGNGSSAGLRVHLAPEACAVEVDNEQKISGETIGTNDERRACERLSADNTIIASGANVTFSAGFRVSLGAGFRVEQGASFGASVDTGRVRGGFVRDDTPASEPHYAVRFLMNADNLNLGTDERLVLLEAEDRLGQRWLSLVMYFDGAAEQLKASAADGAGTTDSAEFAVKPGWQAIELEWWAADPGDNNGKVNVMQDGNAQSGLVGLDNENGRIDSVRWGLLRALDTTDGQMDLDEFVSRRAGPIGLP